MDEPLVSIVLPTYNGEKYIEQSILSCIEQTYRNWELIIVDDASVDRTPDIIHRYVQSDHRIHSIRNGANQKLPKSLNIGFLQAKGQYFTWTSDDNYYHPAAIWEMVNYLNSEHGADIVYADYFTIEDTGQVKKTIHLTQIENLAASNVVGGCFLYSRQVHEKLQGYSVDMYTAEDYDFWLRASLYFRFHHIDKPLYYYRIHNTSLTFKLQDSVRLATEKALSANLDKMEWLSPRMFAIGYGQLAKFAMLRYDRNIARRYAVKAMRHNFISAVRFIPFVLLVKIFAGSVLHNA